MNKNKKYIIDNLYIPDEEIAYYFKWHLSKLPITIKNNIIYDDDKLLEMALYETMDLYQSKLKKVNKVPKIINGFLFETMFFKGNNEDVLINLLKDNYIIEYSADYCYSPLLRKNIRNNIDTIEFIYNEKDYQSFWYFGFIYKVKNLDKRLIDFLSLYNNMQASNKFINNLSVDDYKFIAHSLMFFKKRVACSSFLNNYFSNYLSGFMRRFIEYLKSIQDYKKEGISENKFKNYGILINKENYNLILLLVLFFFIYSNNYDKFFIVNKKYEKDNNKIYNFLKVISDSVNDIKDVYKQFNLWNFILKDFSIYETQFIDLRIVFLKNNQVDELSLLNTNLKKSFYEVFFNKDNYNRLKFYLFKDKLNIIISRFFD